MYFNSNIKFLRKHRHRTQDDIAFALNMKRSTLSGYENGVSEPNLEALVAFSKYFGIAIDTLVKVDLSTISLSQLSQLERGYDVHLKGSNLRVLATTVNNDNNENIELVSRIYQGAADVHDALPLARPQIPHLPNQRRLDAAHSRWFLRHGRVCPRLDLHPQRAAVHRAHARRRHRLQNRGQQNRAREQTDAQFIKPTLSALRFGRLRYQRGVEICALHQRGNARAAREPLPRGTTSANRPRTETAGGGDTVEIEYLRSNISQKRTTRIFCVLRVYYANCAYYFHR